MNTFVIKYSLNRFFKFRNLDGFFKRFLNYIRKFHEGFTLFLGANFMFVLALGIVNFNWNSISVIELILSLLWHFYMLS